MDDAIRERLKPADNTTHAIQLAMVSLHQEQRAAAERLAGLAAEKDELKRTGAHALAKQREADQAAIEAHLRELEAIGEVLDRQYDEALCIAAGEAAKAKVGEAQAAIEKFNLWLAKHYEKAARTIAEGIALEREALAHRDALQRFNAASAALPPLSQVYVGVEARNLSSLCRLPAIQPGQPLHWGM